MPQPSIDPRKRPRQPRSAATFDAILEASARILETGGLAAFNTNAVAEAAGVSIGSLYQYFPSKEAILTELIRRKRTALLEGLRAVALPDLRSTLNALIRAGLMMHLSRPALARSLDYAEATLPLGAETAALKQQIGAAIAEALRARGIADADICARDLTAICRAMAEAAVNAGESDSGALEARVQRAAFGYLGLNYAGPSSDRADMSM